MSSTLEGDLIETSGFTVENVKTLSSHKLVNHDMAVGFAKAIRRLEAPEGDLREWDDRIHYKRRIEEGVELNPDCWGDKDEYDPDDEHEINHIIESFKDARNDPTDQESYNVLKNALEDDIPEESKEVIDRALRVLDGARHIIDLKKGYGYSDSVELEDALWAYEKADGIELEIEDGLDIDDQIRGNGAHKWVTNTLTKNVYDNDVNGDTVVEVERQNGVIKVEYTSYLDDETVCNSKDEREEGLGLNVSKSVVESFGGSFECHYSDEGFNVSYELIPE